MYVLPIVESGRVVILTHQCHAQKHTQVAVDSLAHRLVQPGIWLRVSGCIKACIEQQEWWCTQQ